MGASRKWELNCQMYEGDTSKLSYIKLMYFIGVLVFELDSYNSKFVHVLCHELSNKIIFKKYLKCK